jgi:hypothetical protein
MTATVYAINEPIADHLEDVIAQMEKLGAPTLRMVNCGDFWAAIEGSHRLAAAERLGFSVNVVEVGYDDEISDHDLEDVPPCCTAGEILDYMFRGTPAAAYRLELEV